MGKQSESPLAGIAFLVTWFWIADNFIGAIALWGVGWLAFRLARNAVARLGWTAWSLLAQLTGWFWLFLAATPLQPPTSILALWAAGIPLVMAGSVWRRVAEYFAGYAWLLYRAPLVVAFLGIAIGSVTYAWHGGKFWYGLFNAFAICAMSAVPLYYGYELGAPERRERHDAAFGDEEEFRKAGMAGER